jgi:hypothetical protein
MSIRILQIGIAPLLRTSQVHDWNEPLLLQRMQEHDLSALAECVQDPELHVAVPDSELVDSIAEVFGQRSPRLVSQHSQTVQASKTTQLSTMVTQPELRKPATHWRSVRTIAEVDESGARQGMPPEPITILRYPRIRNCVGGSMGTTSRPRAGCRNLEDFSNDVSARGSC